MTDLDQLVEQAKRSELFTAPRLEADLAAFLAENAGRITALAAEAVASGVEHVYFVGSGGSWSNMFSGKYLLDRFTTLPSDALTSYELIWRNPRRLNSKAWVFLASYSGGTEDTVAALRHARDRDARTIGIVRRRDSVIAREADVVIDYESTALYSSRWPPSTCLRWKWRACRGIRRPDRSWMGCWRCPPGWDRCTARAKPAPRT